MSEQSKLLTVFDSLPDLLAMAGEIQDKEGGHIYDIQDKLRDEHRANKTPFKWSMPYRHIDSCSQCSYVNTAIRHGLENPQISDRESPLRFVATMDIEIHKIREHNEQMPPALYDFLTAVSQKTR